MFIMGNVRSLAYQYLLGTAPMYLADSVLLTTATEAADVFFLLMC
jgi:hypothetical protein